MANQTYHKKAFYYGESFKAIYDKFKRLIREDPDLKKRLPENKREVMIKNGIESFAIRSFISSYVKKNEYKLNQKGSDNETSNNSNALGNSIQ